MQMDHQQKQLLLLLENSLRGKRDTLARYAAALDAMSPLKVLSRGYSVTRREGKIVLRASELQAGDTISIMLHEGNVEAEVTSVSGGEIHEI